MAEELDLLRVADTLLLVPHALAGAGARLAMQTASAVNPATRLALVHETGASERDWPAPSGLRHSTVPQAA